ncbi:MAG: hypothetical protein WBW78_08580, partial [Terrimicrobiaceae bacterium]
AACGFNLSGQRRSYVRTQLPRGRIHIDFGNNVEKGKPPKNSDCFAPLRQGCSIRRPIVHLRRYLNRERL